MSQCHLWSQSRCDSNVRFSVENNPSSAPSATQYCVRPSFPCLDGLLCEMGRIIVPPSQRCWEVGKLMCAECSEPCLALSKHCACWLVTAGAVVQKQTFGIALQEARSRTRIPCGFWLSIILGGGCILNWVYNLTQ